MVTTGNRRVRIKDVAERLGVSTATVSLVLNNVPSRIPAETAAEVKRVAAEMGYRPDLNARSLRTQRTQLIGLVSDYIATTPFAGQIVAGAQEAAWARDNLLLMGNTEDDVAHETALVDALLGRRVDGILYASMFHREAILPESLAGTRVVGIDIHLGPDVPTFVPDEYQGAGDAMRLLLGAGHRRIAHLEGPDTGPATDLRAGAWRDALNAAGVGAAQSLRAKLHEEQQTASAFAEQAALRMLSADDPPTAFFTFNDRMAIGVYRAARNLGLRIPDDLSVVGFDDQQIITLEVTPTLTTVGLPHREMGAQATTHLLDVLDGAEPGGVTAITCPLIERESVAPPPQRSRRG